MFDAVICFIIIILGRFTSERRTWSKMEKEMVESHLKTFIKMMQVPGKEDCEKCIAENPTLQENGRDWKAVKYYLYNRINSIKRNTWL